MRRVLGAVALSGGLVGGLLATSSAGAAQGCPFWTIPPAGFRCVDEDHHVTTVRSGTFDVTTDWLARTSDGTSAVTLGGRLSISTVGDYTVTIELRDADGAVRGSTSRRLRRDNWLQAGDVAVSLPIHLDNGIASVRYTLHDNNSGDNAPVKISRPTD